MIFFDRTTPTEVKGYDPFAIAEQQMQQLTIDTRPKIRPKTAPSSTKFTSPTLIDSYIPEISSAPASVTKKILNPDDIEIKNKSPYMFPGLEPPPPASSSVFLTNIKNRSSIIEPPDEYRYENNIINPLLINSNDNLSISDFVLGSNVGKRTDKFPVSSKPKELKSKEDVEKYFEKQDELFDMNDDLYAEYKEFEKLYLQVRIL